MTRPQQDPKESKPQAAPPDAPAQAAGDLQGEGNYDATRRFDKAERAFVESGKVDEAARAAQPRNPQEAEEMNRAEREARSHSKGEDAASPAPKTNPPR